MAWNGTIATEDEVDFMAGANVSASITQAQKNDLIAQAESYLCCLMRYNVVDNYATIDADVKRILSEYGARYCAVAMIAYDMSGFTSRIEGEDMLNIHLYRMRVLEHMLIDQKTSTYMQGA